MTEKERRRGEERKYMLEGIKRRKKEVEEVKHKHGRRDGRERRRSFGR